MTTPKDLLDWLRDHTDELVADASWLVDLETPSDDLGLLEQGLPQIVDWVRRRVPDFEVVTEHPASETAGAAVVLELAGSGSQPVTMLCHVDTVFPTGTVAERPATVTDGVLRGPGCFDMKVGVVQAVWAVRALQQLNLPLPTLRLVINTDEETGSYNSRPVIEDAARDAAAVLVFEAAADGRLKTARKGVGIFTLTVTGVEAHAGLDPTKGVSAIDELARLILQLHGLTDLAAGTTVNVGVIRGGTRNNVTAGRAEATIDVRVATMAEQQRIQQAFDSLATHHPDARIEVGGGWNRPVMERTEANARIFNQAKEIATQLGLELDEISVGGASDGNFASALGLPVLDGLGATGAGAHALHEHAVVATIPERTAIAAAVIAAHAG